MRRLAPHDHAEHGGREPFTQGFAIGQQVDRPLEGGGRSGRIERHAWTDGWPKLSPENGFCQIRQGVKWLELVTAASLSCARDEPALPRRDPVRRRAVR